MRVYVCVYIYVYVCMCACVYVPVCMCVRACVYVPVWVCVCLYVDGLLHASIYVKCQRFIQTNEHCHIPHTNGPYTIIFTLGE